MTIQCKYIYIYRCYIYVRKKMTQMSILKLKLTWHGVLGGESYVSIEHSEPGPHPLLLIATSVPALFTNLKNVSP